MNLRPSIKAVLDEFGTLPKICLVKQNVYKDLYNSPPNSSPRDLLLSSNMRTGPAGLLAAFPVDFRIVEVAPDPECSVWKQKITDCRHGDLSLFESNITRKHKQIDGGHRSHQDFTVSVDEVDWGIYDIVICYDIAIPRRVCVEFPHVYWACFITEGCMPEFRSSLQRQVPGYQVVLNHHFRPDEDLDKPLSGVHLGAHVIEFPYFLQYSGCFHDILCRSFDNEERSGVILDPRTKGILSSQQLLVLAQFGPVRAVGGLVWQMLDALMASKYYVRLGNHKVLGNSSIEAIASGTLFIGSRYGIKNPYLLGREVTLASVEFGEKQFDELITLLSALESDKSHFETSVFNQRDRLDYLCFIRPVRQLLIHYRRFQILSKNNA